MFDSSRDAPDLEIAKRVLPKPLYKAIKHLFAQRLPDVALVGGTALSGFYAGHRRSDDLDLFCKTELGKITALQAVRSLSTQGAVVQETMNTPHYFRALCEWEGHSFTVDVVLDSNLFRVGEFSAIEGGLVASLKTILRMKAATLVSRCSEKDLYDLYWLFHHLKQPLSMKEFCELAQSVDAGATPEGMLLSLAGAQISKNACDFCTQETPAQGFAKIQSLRKELIRDLKDYGTHNGKAVLQDTIKRARRL